MGEHDADEPRNLEDQVFKALDHETRRNLLRHLGEAEETTFAQMMKALGSNDSSDLSYHLRILTPFVELRSGKYYLSPLGKEAYALLLATTAYGKSVVHMGMAMTEEEHEKWHKDQHEMTPEEHAALMKRMGVSEDADREWHSTHGSPEKSPRNTGRPINPYAIGGSFLRHCVEQGWLVQEGKGRYAKYYLTNEGKRKMRELGIET